MNNNHPLISKSSYLSGLQCHKFLWYKFNAKNEIPEYDAGTQAIFDQGHLVGEYAKKMFPDGIEINTEYYEIEKTIEESKEHWHLGNRYSKRDSGTKMRFPDLTS